MSQYAQAAGCLQASVTSIENQDRITDYLTKEDEITMIFGVGQLFAYQYSNLIEEDQEIVFPEGKIQFPCLDGEAFYVYVKELDTF